MFIFVSRKRKKRKNVFVECQCKESKEIIKQTGETICLSRFLFYFKNIVVVVVSTLVTNRHRHNFFAVNLLITTALILMK